jgi:hypothetical protein
MGDGTNPEPPINSGGGGDSADNNREDEETQPRGLDDYNSDDEPEETEDIDEPSNPDTGTPSVSGGGGAPVGVPSDPTSTQEDPSAEETNEGEEPENPEDAEPPEDSEPELEPEQPNEKPDQDEGSEESEQDHEDDEEEEEDQEAQIVIHSDPWDSIGWGIYPVRLQLKEEYGDQVQFDDRLVPIREFNSPEEMEQHWNKWTPRHGMPVDTEVWTNDPPESTELANRAFKAARQQSIPRAKQFMRRLKMATNVEGTNIEDREIVFDLAENVGLDTDQLSEDWDDVHVRTTVREIETPKTTIHVDGETITQPGLVTANDLKTPLKRAGLEADEPQPLKSFVDEHGPVAMKEVRQVYNYNKEEALTELQTTEGIEPVEYGETLFWVNW